MPTLGTSVLVPMDAVGLTFGLLGASSSTNGYEILSFSANKEGSYGTEITLNTIEFENPISSVMGWAGWYISGSSSSGAMTSAVSEMITQLKTNSAPMFFAPRELGIAYTFTLNEHVITPCSTSLSDDRVSFLYTPGSSTTLTIQSYTRISGESYHAFCAYLYIIF